MLIYSMSVSVGRLSRGPRRARSAGRSRSRSSFDSTSRRYASSGPILCGRRLYETMLVWETDRSLRDDELGATFAEVWCLLPKVVFSRTLDSVQRNARLPEASVSEEVAVATPPTRTSRSAAPAWSRQRSSSASSTSCACSASGHRRWRHAAPVAGHQSRSARPGRGPERSPRA